jgi:Flp pilus assembly protein TadB
MADLKDILSGHNKQLSDEEILKYLQEDILEKEKSAVGEKIHDDPFVADALEGLLRVQNKEKLQNQVNQLNNKLLQITDKRQRKEKRKINITQWVIVTILFLLIICIISYLLITMYHKGAATQIPILNEITTTVFVS